MNKKVLIYGGIGLGVIALGIVGYIVFLKVKQTRSTTEASASNNSSNNQPSSNQQGVTIGQSMLPPSLQGMTQAEINALLSGGRQV
jgi:hypothetical protein